ncbi:MAG: phosphohistidine phosphatase SixA [Candidatus Omnitrophica bacterium CG1_02_46_14]|nr:MAG: phosphohistidine phosphatase SixA [Candidatus Omnitrophica bacterium CG1_02_46_14]
MELYFLRHALAMEPGTGGFSHDSERPLTPEGVEKMKKTAQGMRSLEITLDHIVASPYVRARQTAEIVAEGLKFNEKIRLSDALTPNADFKSFLKLLNEFTADQKILFVGHRPSIGEFVSRLTVGQSSETVDFKPGGLCRVKIPDVYGPESLGMLKWFLTPKQMRLFK